MLRTASTETKITEYLKGSETHSNNEIEAISSIYNSLYGNKKFVTNKDIILGLIEKLETESDPMKLDVYRQALEIVVDHTPDDIES
ncbi:biofilm development regulator YmgB/AriR family protein [Rouxiella chamberiensis]|uniref:Biofilm development regulator YmgB/AriR family protein n=1 Tax=Rouxiella chamberiensis TaxID=1513468 RepID=A0ABY7HTT7_9GAMM|nr:biofilm development regulator YmgB/AriR family protein [Rouxiella chamberiensis]WAT02825.1 biofilm development regulator YmgB/AriR family protein [Rouxiella chamberiensis]